MRESKTPNSNPTNPSRRQLLEKMLLGGTVAVGASIASGEEKVLAQHVQDNSQQPDAVSGATPVHTNWGKLSDLKEKIPGAQLCGFPCSRMFLGGNLVSGFAHARDLIYVSDLVLAYHTKQKVFATFQMAEACGIDTFLMNPRLCEMIEEYWNTGGKLQFMTNCSGNTAEQLMKNLQRSIDFGASSCVIQGEVTDRLVRERKFDTIRQGMDLIRKHDIPAGLAAHRIETLKACVDQKIRPDYWMKTFHHLNYWSARPGKSEHDNVFCRDPEETMKFMSDQPEPWIAFKVLAAGSIPPADGFRFAFEGGADLICVGMYDFQIVDDVNICVDVLKTLKNRKRAWIC